MLITSRKITITSILIFFIFLNIIPKSSSSQPCYAIAIDSPGYDSTSYLVEFDAELGYTKYISKLDGNVRSIAVNPNNGKIYTARYNEFGTLNPVTGEFEKINDLGEMLGQYGLFTPDSIRGMAFDSYLNIIYAVDYNFDKLGAQPGSEDLLFGIDPRTGKIIRDYFEVELTQEIVDYAVIETVEAGTNAGGNTFQPLMDVWDITVNPDSGELCGYHRDGLYAFLTILNPYTGTVEQDIGDVSNKDYLGVSYSRDGSSFYFTTDRDPQQDKHNILFEREFDGTLLGDQYKAGFIDAQKYVFKTIDCGINSYLSYASCQTKLEVTNMLDTTNTVYKAADTINSNLYLSKDVEFYAGTEINIFSGFEAGASTNFLATIENCN